MPAPSSSNSKQVAVILGALLLLLFASPVATWWSSAGLHWLTPYGIWLGVILAAAFVHAGDSSDDP